ncbi:MFS transporter [Cellulomonas iranensis]|uniref:MFS transporter n=1 Tax=Cellulomonas iranensis TaxID=76862 RepID=UPI000B3D1CBF|nr:MFS transporter [Cellulomonas iranensis]
MAPTPADPVRPRRAIVALTASLLTIELLAGVQTYVTQTVLPLLVADLGGAHLYGPLDAAAQAPTFLMLPAGAWLLARFRTDRLLLWFTALAVVGSATCALAPSAGVLLAGTAVRAVAAGALATVSMGAIVRGLPARHRQLVLAGLSGTWVVSSLLGPLYAVAVAQHLGWRWALVLHLPLLVAARAVAARCVPSEPAAGAGERVPWGWAVVLAAGSLTLALPVGPWSALAVAVGAALMLRAAAALLPAGALRARRGRPAALSALLAVASAYFGATAVLSVVGHDALGLAPHAYGLVVAVPGLAWAVCGLWTGAHPALDDARFRRRGARAAWGLVAGAAVVAVTGALADRPALVLAGLLVGAALLGGGMGSLYPDLLGRCLARPDPDDGLSDARAATAVVLAEAVGLALATTAAFTWLGSGLGLVHEPRTRVVVLYAALVAVALVAARRLAAAARSRP